MGGLEDHEVRRNRERKTAERRTPVSYRSGLGAWERGQGEGKRRGRYGLLIARRKEGDRRLNRSIEGRDHRSCPLPCLRAGMTGGRRCWRGLTGGSRLAAAARGKKRGACGWDFVGCRWAAGGLVGSLARRRRGWAGPGSCGAGSFYFFLNKTFLSFSKTKQRQLLN